MDGGLPISDPPSVSARNPKSQNPLPPAFGPHYDAGSMTAICRRYSRRLTSKSLVPA
jgi:hypothetical protein